MSRSTIPQETSEAATFTSTAFGTTRDPKLSQPTNAPLLQHSSALATPTSTAVIWPDHVPDLPHTIIWILAGGLSFGFVAAVCLFLIDFYPRHPRGVQLQRQRKRDFREVPQGEVELDSYSTSRTPITLDWHEDARKPMVRRRQKPKNLSVDTNAQYHGLGIAIPAETGSASTTSSSSSLQVHPKTWTSLRSPLFAGKNEPESLLQVEDAKASKEMARAMRHWHPVDNRFDPTGEHQPTVRLRSPTVLRKSIHSKSISTQSNDRTPDLEAGDFSTSNNRFLHNREEDSPPQSPYPSPLPSPADSTLCLLLDKGEGAIDYIATKFARIMYAQVKDDPEEGLLLHVRRSERERGGGGGGRMVGIS